MEHLFKQNIFWAINQESMNSKGFKSYDVYSLTTMKLKQKPVRERSQETIPNIWKHNSKQYTNQ